MNVRLVKMIANDSLQTNDILTHFFLIEVPKKKSLEKLFVYNCISSSSHTLSLSIVISVNVVYHKYDSFNDRKSTYDNTYLVNCIIES